MNVKGVEEGEGVEGGSQDGNMKDIRLPDWFHRKEEPQLHSQALKDARNRKVTWLPPEARKMQETGK